MNWWKFKSWQRNLQPTDLTRRFLNSINKQFPKDNKLHKIFNRRSEKVGYSCTENTKSVITVDNKTLLSETINAVAPWNCRVKNKFPLNRKSRTSNILYKCVTATSTNSDKVYLGTTGGDFKRRFYNHKKSFNSSIYHNDTALSRYNSEIKEKYRKAPFLKWYIVKRASSYWHAYNQNVFTMLPLKIRNIILP